MRGIATGIALCWVLLIAAAASAEPLQQVAEDEKCPVCGMFVASHPQWLAQIVGAGGKTRVFDGVKDMMAYYFDAGRYGGGDPSTAEIWVRNYYTLAYLDGRQAFYVLGSDVRGPMGEELIPFATREEAESFKKDHHGTSILRFDEIGVDLIDGMRRQHKMKMKQMKKPG